MHFCQELSKARNDFESRLREDVSRSVKDMSERLQERSEETRSLRAITEADRVQLDALMRVTTRFLT